MWNMERIRLTASEDMSFENVEGRTTDRRRMPVYTVSSPMSLRLRRAYHECQNVTSNSKLHKFIECFSFKLYYLFN